MVEVLKSKRADGQRAWRSGYNATLTSERTPPEFQLIFPTQGKVITKHIIKREEKLNYA